MEGAARALVFISYNSEHNQHVITDYGGLPLLCTALSQGSLNPLVAERTIRALYNVAGCSTERRMEVIREGGLALALTISQRYEACKEVEAHPVLHHCIEEFLDRVDGDGVYRRMLEACKFSPAASELRQSPPAIPPASLGQARARQSTIWQDLLVAQAEARLCEEARVRMIDEQKCPRQQLYQRRREAEEALLAAEMAEWEANKRRVAAHEEAQHIQEQLRAALSVQQEVIAAATEVRGMCDEAGAGRRLAQDQLCHGVEEMDRRLAATEAELSKGRQRYADLQRRQEDSNREERALRQQCFNLLQEV